MNSYHTSVHGYHTSAARYGVAFGYTVHTHPGGPVIFAEDGYPSAKEASAKANEDVAYLLAAEQANARPFRLGDSHTADDTYLP